MILVLGATGKVGRHLVRHLSARGAPFKALVRDEGKGAALGCRFVVGDLDRPDSVRSALDGVERLFVNGASGPDMLVQQTGAIDAAKAAGVRYVVKLSSVGADASAETPMGRAHGQIEEHLKRSGVEWTVLRPGFFMQNFFRNAGTIRRDSALYGAYRDGRISFIDADDIGAAAAALLAGEGGRGQTFVLTGKEALTHEEVARRFSRALGRAIRYVDLPVPEVVERAKAEGMPPPFAQALGAMMTMLATGEGAATTDAVATLTGRPPRTFDDFLSDNLAAFA